MLIGFFDKLFGKKPAAPASARMGDDDIRPTDSQPIDGPPEFILAAEMQRAYWTYDAEEQMRLEARGDERLSWPERLRLHHLTCLQRLNTGAERAVATEKCLRSARALIAPESPYRPRAAMIWQGQSAQSAGDREPDMQGEFLNPSLTHLGCLEVYRLDAANRPARLDFVGFDELSGVVLAPPSLIRAANLFGDDGREEVVLVPLLYGLTWAIGNEFDRAGRMTRFVAHVHGEDIETLGASGIGVGQQDFSARGRGGEGRLFGLGSVAELAFPLDMRDPRFDAKARARRIDPDEVRRSMGAA